MARRSHSITRRSELIARTVILAALGVILPLCGPLPAPAQIPEPPPGVSIAPPPDSAQLDRLHRRGLPFGPGERLEFSIDYGPIHAGTATLEVLGMMKYRGRDCYHFVSQARSARMFDSIYKVRDRIDAMVDAGQFFTWQYRKIQKEGEYRANHKILYDHDRSEAHYGDGEVMPFPEGALDGLSAFYFARLQPLAVGETFLIPHHSDKRTFFLRVTVQGREKVKVPLGEFDCWVLVPQVGEAGPFKSSGNMRIWITTDHRRMPVLLKSKIGPGSIAASLTHVTYGRPIPQAPEGATPGS